MMRRIELPEDDPHTFIIYYNWLFRNNICFRDGSDIQKCYAECIRFYLFGEKVKNEKFRRCVLGAWQWCNLQNQGCAVPDAGDIRYAYDNTLPSSELRTMIAGTVAGRLGDKDVLSIVDKDVLPKVFLADLLKATRPEQQKIDVTGPLTTPKNKRTAEESVGSKPTSKPKTDS